jgi:hypothetical protein
MHPGGMSAGGRLKIGQILISKGLITPEQLAAALADQENSGKRLGHILVARGAIDEEALVKVVARQLRLPVARIRGKTIDPEILDLVPSELSEKHRCLPLFLREEDGSKQLFIAMEDPSDSGAVDDISFRVGLKVRPVLVAPSELEDAIERHYHATELMPETPGLPSLAPRTELEPEEEDDSEPSLPPPQPLLDPNLDLPGPGGDGPSVDLGELGLGGGLDDLDDLSGDPLGNSSDDFSLEGEPFAADAAGPEAPQPELAPAPVAAPVPAPARPAAARRSAALEPEVLLQALAQLLVEKGVITRDEFAERVRRLSETQR